MKILAALFILTVAACAAPKMVALKVMPPAASIAFAGATQQFVAVASYDDGTELDVTDAVQWRVSDPAVAKFTDAARLAALRDGKVVITATLPAGGGSGQSRVLIQGSQVPRPFSFARDIGGILTKRGCNQRRVPRRRKRTGRIQTFRERALPDGRLRVDHERRRIPGSHRRGEGRAHSAHRCRNPEDSLLLAEAHHDCCAWRRQALRARFGRLRDHPRVDSERRALRHGRRK